MPRRSPVSAHRSKYVDDAARRSCPLSRSWTLTTLISQASPHHRRSTSPAKGGPRRRSTLRCGPALRPCVAPSSRGGDGDSLCSSELCAGRGLPVRLEPRDRSDQRRDRHREGRACPALPQPHAVRTSLSRRHLTFDPLHGPSADPEQLGGLEYPCSLGQLPPHPGLNLGVHPGSAKRPPGPRT